MPETFGPQAGRVAPTEIRYIKLGAGGAFAKDCFDTSVLALGFETIPHTLCLERDWVAVRQRFLDAGKSAGKAEDHVRELKAFYELGADTLWITFADGRLWWAFADETVRWDAEALGRLPRRRAIIDRWRSDNIKAAPLLVRDLSTRLTCVAAYRGTICAVQEGDYLLRKINAEQEPLVAEAVAAQLGLEEYAQRLIQRLHERDFELLVDLIFAASGWRRVSVLGESEKDIDLLVEQIATNERAFVQVKSRATNTTLKDYTERFRAYAGADRMIFACHSPSVGLAKIKDAGPNVEVWLASTLAAKTVRAGLFDWLIERVR